MLKKPIYLDYAAATPLDPNVKKAMDRAEIIFANPSAQYASAREAKTLIEKSRKEVAMFLGANSDEVVFTSGATESNNLAVLGVARMRKKGRIISIATEHASVREPLEQLEKEGYDVAWCKVGSDGILSSIDFEHTLNKDTILVSLAYANGEIGSVQPIIKISKIIREFEKANKTQILFHSDASAATLFLNCDVSRLGVDLLTVNANKVYGPKGIGALYVKRGTKLQPIQFGGSQEFGLRAGTESISLAIGLASALKIAQTKKSQNISKAGKLMFTLNNLLKKDGKLNVVGSAKHHERLLNIMTLYFDGINGEDIVAYMDAAGFEVATGAACEAANEEPSKALLSLGLTKSQARGSVRISIGRDTTQAQVESAAKSLVKTLKKLGYLWESEK